MDYFIKKVFAPLTLAVLILCSSFAQAAAKVVVVPLGGTHVYIDPANIVSFYHEWLTGSAGEYVTDIIFTVPADNHFVLTNLAAVAFITLYENDTPKLKIQVGGVHASSSGYQP